MNGVGSDALYDEAIGPRCPRRHQPGRRIEPAAPTGRHFRKAADDRIGAARFVSSWSADEAPDEVSCTCWCEKAVVLIPVEWVALGRTRSCGRRECGEPGTVRLLYSHPTTYELRSLPEPEPEPIRHLVALTDVAIPVGDLNWSDPGPDPEPTAWTERLDMSEMAKRYRRRQAEAGAYSGKVWLQRKASMLERWVNAS